MSKTRKKIKVLIVAMANSVHTARWISRIQEADSNIEVALFDSIGSGTEHAELKDIDVYHQFYRKKNRQVKQHGLQVFHETIVKSSEKYFGHYKSKKLRKVIKTFRPDIIHSLETQHAGYLVETVRKSWSGDSFPRWIHSVWGSDLFLFGKIEKHQPQIKDLLHSCDVFVGECQRDVNLAKQFGFTGKIAEPIIATGGFDVSAIDSLYAIAESPEKRKGIIIKGYQGWAGRALCALRAIELCADSIRNYVIYLYSATDEGVLLKVELLRALGIKVVVIPPDTSHKEMLRYFSLSRIAIALSISDGISSAFIEALAMGTFPIQSNTLCLDDDVKSKVSARFVEPESPEETVAALQMALTDDRLVISAAQKNREVVQHYFDSAVLARRIKTIYALP